MAQKKVSTTELLDYLLYLVRQNDDSEGMMAKAAKHFGVSTRTITRVLDGLRRDKLVGRGVYRRWRNSRHFKV